MVRPAFYLFLILIGERIKTGIVKPVEDHFPSVQTARQVHNSAFSRPKDAWAKRNPVSSLFWRETRKSAIYRIARSDFTVFAGPIRLEGQKRHVYGRNPLSAKMQLHPAVFWRRKQRWNQLKDRRETRTMTRCLRSAGPTSATQQTSFCPRQLIKQNSLNCYLTNDTQNTSYDSKTFTQRLLDSGCGAGGRHKSRSKIAVKAPTQKSFLLSARTGGRPVFRPISVIARRAATTKTARRSVGRGRRSLLPFWERASACNQRAVRDGTILATKVGMRRTGAD